jgi:hypothetical protein
MCPATRGQFTLNAGARVEFDFELIKCGFDAPPSGYEREELDHKNPPGSRPLLHYGFRKEYHPAVEYIYTGVVNQGIYVRPMMTYDVYTLRANSITYERTREVIIGEGNVAWQDGTTTKPGEYIELSLQEPLVIRLFR